METQHNPRVRARAFELALFYFGTSPCCSDAAPLRHSRSIRPPACTPLPQAMDAGFRLPVIPATLESAATRASYAFFALFSTHEARALRRVCSELRDAVAAHPWKDMARADYGPGAVARELPVRAGRGDRQGHTLCRGRRAKGRRAFTLLAGIRELNMGRCNQSRHYGRCVSPPPRHPQAKHTMGLQRFGDNGRRLKLHLAASTLDISYCDQRTITDAAFAHPRRHPHATHV